MNDLFCLRTSNTDRVIIIDVEDKDRILIHNDRWYELPKGMLNARSKIIARKIYLSRVIMCARKHEQVDHINHNTLDNRKINLRICKQTFNNANCNKRNGNNITSKYKGVSFVKKTGRWRARVIKYGVEYCKYCATELDAAKVYNELAKFHFGSFANLNII